MARTIDQPKGFPANKGWVGWAARSHLFEPVANSGGVQFHSLSAVDIALCPSFASIPEGFHERDLCLNHPVI